MLLALRLHPKTAKLLPWWCHALPQREGCVNALKRRHHWLTRPSESCADARARRRKEGEGDPLVMSCLLMPYSTHVALLATIDVNARWLCSPTLFVRLIAAHTCQADPGSARTVVCAQWPHGARPRGDTVPRKGAGGHGTEKPDRNIS